MGLSFDKIKHYLGYGIALLVIGLGIRFAVNEHIDKLVAAKEVEAKQREINARDDEQKKASALFDQRIASLKTPEQAQPIIRTIFLPQPGDSKEKIDVGSPINVRKDQLSPEVQAQLPDAPTLKPDAPVTLLTPDQTIQLGKFTLDCQKKEGELSTCQADLKAKDQQISELQTALKGGSKGQKLLKALKCLGASGGGAGLGALLNKKTPALGASIGAIAGGATCEIFF